MEKGSVQWQKGVRHGEKKKTKRSNGNWEQFLTHGEKESPSPWRKKDMVDGKK